MFQCRTQHCVCRDPGDRHQGRQGRGVSMPHAALCVSRHNHFISLETLTVCFNAARSIVCVETCSSPVSVRWQTGFNAARSIVCVETSNLRRKIVRGSVSMPHAALCVSRPREINCFVAKCGVSMPHAALCVSRRVVVDEDSVVGEVSMPHAALCVSRHCVPQPLSRAG